MNSKSTQTPNTSQRDSSQMNKGIKLPQSVKTGADVARQRIRLTPGDEQRLQKYKTSLGDVLKSTYSEVEPNSKQVGSLSHKRYAIVADGKTVFPCNSNEVSK